MIDLLTTPQWQMTFGERAALEGILEQLKPQLSIEIGTAEGGSLRRISAHSSEVHSFDLVEPDPVIRQLSNVTLHTGDSHVLLAEYLVEAQAAGLNVDFALVDGDHTAEGVRQDIEALLSSNAVRQCVILIHDTANDIVREGVERVRYEAYPQVTYVDLDFVSGHLSDGGPFHHQLWGGIGLVIVDAQTGAPPQGPQANEFYSSFEILAAIRDGLSEAERKGRTSAPSDVVLGDDEPRQRELELEAELQHARVVLASITGSASWRATAPLRSLKRAMEARRSG